MLKDRSQGGGGQVVGGEHETRLRFRLLGLRVHPRLVRSVPDGESCGSAQDEYTTDMDGSIYLRLVTSEKTKTCPMLCWLGSLPTTCTYAFCGGCISTNRRGGGWLVRSVSTVEIELRSKMWRLSCLQWSLLNSHPMMNPCHPE